MVGSGEKETEMVKPPEVILEENITLVREILVDGTREIRRAKEIVKPGGEAAEIEFEGNLFLGKFTSTVAQKVHEGLGVDLETEPDFCLTGEFEYDVWTFPGRDTELHILKRTKDGITELLLHDFDIELMFEEDNGLERK